jgi:predicted glycoside hydrolase/deacetylase ChbG (UPF0249 family)
VPAKFILIADDFGMTRGISEGILALATAGRLSGAGAMVNMPWWPGQAAAAMKLRDRFALGLHLNLTFGPPLGSMPKLAPDGAFPGMDRVVGRAVSRQIDRAEVGDEIERQLDRFQTIAGVPPDFVDGHHHVHGLPGIRDELVAALKRRFPAGGPLIRDPADRPLAILRRRVAATKAATAATLVAGFGKLARGAGFATNEGFSGYSTFGSIPYADEFPAFLIDAGPRPMIMCHPGLPDGELGDRDSIAGRRPEEHGYLSGRAGLPDLIWHPAVRDAAGFPWAVGAHG